MWSESLKAFLLMESQTKVNHFLIWGGTFSHPFHPNTVARLVSLRLDLTDPDTSVLSFDLI